MRKQGLVVLATAFFSAAFSFAVAQEPGWEEVGRGNTDFRCVLVNPDNPKMIFAAAKRGLLKSEDGGASWRQVLSVRGDNRRINFLAFGFTDKNTLYAAAGMGLYRSLNQGKNWERIFRGKNADEAEGLAFAALPGTLYLGTKAGLFSSCDNGRTWNRADGKVGVSKILSIVYHPKEPQDIYLACLEGVFRSQNNGKNWERVFSVQAVEDGKESEEENEDRDEEERFSEIRYLSIDPNKAGCLYLADIRGVYKSEDRGTTWEMLPDYGLLSRQAQLIALSEKSEIFCLTKSGIFELRSGRWEELSFALSCGEVRYLAFGAGNIYAACERGLFRMNLSAARLSRRQETMDLYTRNEPKINEVREVAIKYAEVSPEKIIRWRKQAAKRAWLPKFSAGVNRDTSDLWHWESGSTTKAYDDVLIRGRETVDWDVSLSWDLGDLIWSDNQVSIDTRSRLMVQLRDDVLDEVTKAYFERIRVKMELDNLSIEDRKKRFEKELRLEELTATLDSFTGGFFSQKIQSAKAHP